jgi:2-polyprenyl-6-methoxyphenol hydroxylase-like FAD-dependent oxidoreductase
MAGVVVVGGSVAGLGTALSLARTGHEVTVLERDATPLPPNPDAAFEWDRRGAPQVRHSHALLARLHNLLRDRYPDVLDSLYAAGATEIRLTERLPDTIDDRTPKPGDEDLVMIACRRTTFEWVLRRVVLAEAGVTFRDGVRVDGLAADGRTVAGVRLDGGDVVRGDAVVAANGRRAPLPEWLGAIGVAVPEAVEDTGIVYFSRFYRLLDGAEPPEQGGAIGGDLGYLKYATFLGDNHTFSVTFAVANDDDELRARILDAGTFERAAHALPATAPWTDQTRAAPITGVHVMARLLNRIRRFTDDDGEPTVLGFHAVGDAHTCTNPLYGRGCSLAMVQASLLADAFTAHPDDPAARGRAYEEASAREVEPWYRAAVIRDRETRGETDGQDEGRAFMRSLLTEGLAPAMRTDAVVLRAFFRSFNLLTPPDALITDPDVVGRVLNVWNDRDNRPPEPELGPDRDGFLAAIA